jgi:hypothetical protein
MPIPHPAICSFQHESRVPLDKDKGFVKAHFTGAARKRRFFRQAE